MAPQQATAARKHTKLSTTLSSEQRLIKCHGNKRKTKAALSGNKVWTSAATGSTLRKAVSCAKETRNSCLQLGTLSGRHFRGIFS